ncbi:DoxX family protein [Muricauda sp. SCSIO 64092]|uniref:DoxX family protein n=1 Tax=Allomuricauda sp. SCSIO 64092 TaxID=2908842 RepID=UPI001FF35791|nr:DoxX family protein [Muricauda sp. SCSIO 64092]UOY05785.1 DoxX family protein [Muricauda sp. SCSIO 64092]
MKKTNKTLYWVFTGLLSLLMVTSVTRYFMDIEQFQNYFTAFGYNGRIVVHLAIAKLLAVVVILANKWPTLKEWAYAGLFFDFVLALEAHIHLKDDQFFGPIIALVLLALSYAFYRKVLRDNEDNV